jgi:hypothetical protein
MFLCLVIGYSKSKSLILEESTLSTLKKPYAIALSFKSMYYYVRMQLQ